MVGLVGLSTAAAASLSAWTSAEPSRASAQPPSLDEEIVWSTFVGGPGRSPSRADVSADPGTIEIEGSSWQCGYGRPRRAAISPTDWSVQRVLACQREGSSVRATASCRVRGDRLEEHAATLGLSAAGEPEHVTVTLSCRRR